MRPWIVLGTVAAMVVALALVVYLEARPKPVDNPGGPARPGPRPSSLSAPGPAPHTGSPHTGSPHTGSDAPVSC